MTSPRPAQSALVSQIVASYDDAVIRLYCSARFRVINLRILEQVEQYVSRSGSTLDLGCGFGLFSLYFALSEPKRHLVSIDRNPRRIEIARHAAAQLGVDERTHFVSENVLDVTFERKHSTIVLIDLVHHLPPDAVDPILEHCWDSLEPGGVLLVKDVDAEPWAKMAFTWLLDKAMDWRTPVHYLHRFALREKLEGIGFDVKIHQIVDYLPYPHVLLVCRKP